LIICPQKKIIDSVNAKILYNKYSISDQAFLIREISNDNKSYNNYLSNLSFTIISDTEEKTKNVINLGDIVNLNGNNRIAIWVWVLIVIGGIIIILVIVCILAKFINKRPQKNERNNYKISVNATSVNIDSESNGLTKNTGSDYKKYIS